ncbi:hypothetical protein C8F04DRAFT_277251 [Mycena alexandri]|uniref:Uncharacterized protein n=1 Tax=Mycena alexandri TaxID=1745969 RepID=A0AAD6WPZ8_9AGAR|nr:hypothetical protein C8F04DRAFT_277251 [Mycena alexandri]
MSWPGLSRYSSSLANLRRPPNVLSSAADSPLTLNVAVLLKTQISKQPLSGASRDLSRLSMNPGYHFTLFLSPLALLRWPYKLFGHSLSVVRQDLCVAALQVPRLASWFLSNNSPVWPVPKCMPPDLLAVGVFRIGCYLLRGWIQLLCDSVRDHFSGVLFGGGWIENGLLRTTELCGERKVHVDSVLCSPSCAWDPRYSDSSGVCLSKTTSYPLSQCSVPCAWKY